MGVYGNPIKVSKIVLKCARLLKLKPSFRNTLFNRKKWLKGYCGNEGLNLVWDRMGVRYVALFNTTLADCVVHKGHIKKIWKEKWAFLMNLETFMSATAIGKLSKKCFTWLKRLKITCFRSS